MTKEVLLQQYEVMSNEELYEMNIHIQDYTEEAREALALVVEQRGGIEAIAGSWNKTHELRQEEHRIRQDVNKLFTQDASPDFYSKLIVSERLPEMRVTKLINDQLSVLYSQRENAAIKPRTVYGSLLGSLLSIVAGGLVWGVFLIETHRIFLFLAIAVVFMCYFMIRSFTKQNKENKVVLIATVISSALAFLFGQFLFEIFG